MSRAVDNCSKGNCGEDRIDEAQDNIEEKTDIEGRIDDRAEEIQDEIDDVTDIETHVDDRKEGVKDEVLDHEIDTPDLNNPIRNLR